MIGIEATQGCELKRQPADGSADLNRKSGVTAGETAIYAPHLFEVARLCIDKAATSPSREVDAHITRLISPHLHHAPRYTKYLGVAVTLLPVGFWWRGGTCSLSSEVRVCPDHNDPAHRERLLRDCPPTVEQWNEGIEVEIRPGGDQALICAFVAVCLQAHGLLALRGNAHG